MSALARIGVGTGGTPGAILFFRMGDFYEMFFEDAVYVAGALGLTLTTRDKGKPESEGPLTAYRALFDVEHRAELETFPRLWRGLW